MNQSSPTIQPLHKTSQQALAALPKYYVHALLMGLGGIAAWELAGLDVPMARLSFNAASQSFEWRNHWLLTTVLHSIFRNVIIFGALYVLTVSVLPQVWRKKMPLLGGLPRAANAMFFVMLMTPAALVSALKSQSVPFCPWDEAGLGGFAPAYHWWQPLFENMTGKFGRCWPAGHASAGFSLLAVYFFARHFAPKLAVKALVFALSMGLVMGLAQQVRGAHFMSHTLWTAWLAWATCGLLAPWLKKWTLPT